MRASTSTPTSLGENAESSGKRQPSAIDRIGQAWAEAAIAPRAAHSAHRSHAPCPMRAGRGENPSGRTCAEPSRFSKTPRRTNKQITQTDPQTRKQTRSAFRFVSFPMRTTLLGHLSSHRQRQGEAQTQLTRRWRVPTVCISLEAAGGKRVTASGSQGWSQTRCSSRQSGQRDLTHSMDGHCGRLMQCCLTRTYAVLLSERT